MSNLKRFLALTLAMLMVVGAMAVSAKSFTDVASTDSYAEAVDVLSELGVIAGTSTDEFSPDALVSREQMAMFIARLATAQPSWFAVEAPAVFADQKDPTYNAAIAYASSNGFVKGTDTAKNLFDGTASVTLQEAATMLSRVLGYTTEAMDKAYPMSYLTMADDVGLLKGLEDVAPTAALTRGEVATMLYNAFKAPMATTFLTSNSTGGVIVNVSIPTDLVNAKRLMTTKWKVERVPSYIGATKDFRFESLFANTTKTLKDPVNLAGIGTYSFATIAKFFPEDASANDYLGVDLVVLMKNDGKILSISIEGDVTTTTSASYVADTKVATVEGTAYDLANYFAGTYPTTSDNCFYYYNANVITKFTASDVAKLADISTGFFSIDIINADESTQKIVFKPYAFSKVTKNADGKLVVNADKVITNNTAKAVESDYVVYFNGGSNKVDVIAVAAKSAAQKVVKINNTTKIATLDSGATAPFGTAPILGHGILSSLSIGGSYYIYTVDGKVVMTENAAAPAPDYTPKSYYWVIDSDTVTGEFGAVTYKIKVVDQAGTGTIKNITKVDGVAVTDVTLAGLVNGKIIVLDSSDATLAYTAANASFFGAATPTPDDEINALGAVAAISNSGKIFTLGTTDVVLTSATKVVVYNGDPVASTYAAYTGTNFAGVNEASTKYFAVYHTNNTVKELVYLFVIGTVKSGDTAPDDFYLFINKGDITATTVDYVALSLKTGETKIVSYVDANGTTIIGAAAVGTATEIYNVKDSIKVPTQYTTNVNSNTFIVQANGYITAGSALYSTINTKYYVWNTTTLTYDAKTFTDIDKIKVNTGHIVYDANKNATYVVITGQDVFAGVISKSAATNTITLTSDVAADKIYYSLDNGTTYVEYTAPFAVTGTVGATVTIKAYATKAGYINGAVATLTHTIV